MNVPPRVKSYAEAVSAAAAAAPRTSSNTTCNSTPISPSTSVTHRPSSPLSKLAVVAVSDKYKAVNNDDVHDDDTPPTDALNLNLDPPAATKKRSSGFLPVHAGELRPTKRRRRWCDVVERLSLQNGEEVDGHRLAQRQKQIDFGKNTLAYDRFVEVCPRHSRRRGDPMTPVINQVCSKRSFLGQVISWRKAVYSYVDKLEDGVTPGAVAVTRKNADDHHQQRETLAQDYNVDAVERAKSDGASCDSIENKKESSTVDRQAKTEYGKNKNRQDHQYRNDVRDEKGRARNYDHGDGKCDEQVDSPRPSSDRTCIGSDADQDHDEEGRGTAVKLMGRPADMTDVDDTAAVHNMDMEMSMDVDFLNDCEGLDEIQLDDQGNVLPSIEYPPNTSSTGKENTNGKETSIKKDMSTSIFASF